MSTFTVTSPEIGGSVYIGAEDTLMSDPLHTKDLLLIIRCLEEHRNVTLMSGGHHITADSPDSSRVERLSLISDAGVFVSFENTDNSIVSQLKNVLSDSYTESTSVCEVAFIERDYDRAQEQPICVSIEKIATDRYGQETYRGIKIADVDEYLMPRFTSTEENKHGTTRLTKDEAIRLRDALTELIDKM